VPLLVKLPGQRDGEIHDTPVQTIDIVPTIAEVLGFPAPWQLDGQSLLAAERRPAQRQISGQPFHTDFAEVAGPALQRKLRLFGQGRTPLYPPGPHAELVGRSVGTFAALPPTDCALRFTYAKAYENVRPGLAPNYVKALLDCAPGPEAALAVNGTIVATTRTFAGIGQGSELGVMVPEQAFRAGRNEVKSYLIEKDSRGIIGLRSFASR
jgi:hypothetical protein